MRCQLRTRPAPRRSKRGCLLRSPHQQRPAESSRGTCCGIWRRVAATRCAFAGLRRYVCVPKACQYIHSLLELLARFICSCLPLSGCLACPPLTPPSVAHGLLARDIYPFRHPQAAAPAQLAVSVQQGPRCSAAGPSLTTTQHSAALSAPPPSRSSRIILLAQQYIDGISAASDSPYQ